MQETRVWFLCWEDPAVEEGMTIHSSIHSGRIPVVRGAWWAIVLQVAKSRTWLKQWTEIVSLHFWSLKIQNQDVSRAVLPLKALGQGSLSFWASQVAPVLKNPPANAGDIGDVGSILGSGRFLGGGHGNPLQYSCLENLIDRGTWRAVVHRVSKKQTWLNWLSTHVPQPFWHQGLVSWKTVFP